MGVRSTFGLSESGLDYCLPRMQTKQAEKKPEAANQKYGWREMNEDLKNRHFLGNYGGQNGVYQAVAEAQAGLDLNAVHCLRHEDEHMVHELVELLNTPRVQERWDDCISINPWGLWAPRPTIAATYARMDLPELKLVVDGQIVHEDQSISVIKAGLEPVWNIPGIAERLNLDEGTMREALKRYTAIPEMTDKSKRTFLPSIGGATVYFFGDPRKLAEPSTEVAVRCHDECNGSDVFCTDICTCRPYLLFAIQGAVECAQRGGVGLIAYFRKEGRALGEVTKYRVYNARKNQPGGDRPEMYFKQTEAIAGIRDARLQELMPDVLLWLGIRRIDWLLSMSSDKYNAITAAGIEVRQRVSLPDDYIPRDAHVELTAKISAGYHCEKVDQDSVQKKVSQLTTIRERCNLVFDLVQSGKSRFFTLDLSKLDNATQLVVDSLLNTYGAPSKVPYHSRARHFEVGGEDLLEGLHSRWREIGIDAVEAVRRVLDLTVISVLTDAGAGNDWSYLDKHRKQFQRSEGLAVASYDLFLEGVFSSDRALKHRVNSLGLKDLTLDVLKHGYQITNENPMVGIEGRLKKLHDLARSLEEYPEYFGSECPRPGHLVDYVLSKIPEKGERRVSVNVLWDAVITGLKYCWPAKSLLGVSHGDVWQSAPLKVIGKPGSDIVAFHKLPQWLMYSLVEVFERFLSVKFDDLELLTGLAEYRNGGLFVDTGVIQLKSEDIRTQTHDVGSEVIVEWRALTVILIDKLAEQMRQRLGCTPQELPVAKVLQAGTWQVGRDLAKQLRAGAPPINVHLDGTVF
eukprot:c46359_g1_i1.p1 GENE.c46359_g1_i1~~c46359_g1_i1.p1  ORF type:complete len:798 (-),score=133.55 c46359_g1_i1:94-2487(-)